jgi:hypothetical protein
LACAPVDPKVEFINFWAQQGSVARRAIRKGYMCFFI